MELKRAISPPFIHKKSFFSTQPFAPREFATSIRAEIQFGMSIYIAAKAGHVTKAFANGLFVVGVGAFLFIAVNLPNIAAKSSFRGQAYASGSIVGDVMAKICFRTVGIF